MAEDDDDEAFYRIQDLESEVERLKHEGLAAREAHEAALRALRGAAVLCFLSYHSVPF